MALLARKKIILAKIETTYGTDASPLGANAILVRNVNVMPMESDVAERDLIRPYLGNSDRITAAARIMVEFECELMGSGTAGTAPQFGPLLRACAMAETVVASTSVAYAPVSASFESCTIYVNVDGVLHKLTGARGTYTVELNNKQIPVIKFSMTGRWAAATDAAAPTPTYTTTIPLAVNNLNTTAFTFHGYSAVASQFSFDIGNTVVHRTLVGGTEEVLITARNATGQLQIEATTVAAKDWFTIAKNNTPGALTVTHGTVAGNKVKIDAPAVSIVKPTYAELEGIQMLQFDLVLMPGGTGNDELKFLFT